MDSFCLYSVFNSLNHTYYTECNFIQDCISEQITSSYYLFRAFITLRISNLFVRLINFSEKLNVYWTTVTLYIKLPLLNNLPFSLSVLSSKVHRNYGNLLRDEPSQNEATNDPIFCLLWKTPLNKIPYVYWRGNTICLKIHRKMTRPRNLGNKKFEKPCFCIPMVCKPLVTYIVQSGPATSWYWYN